MPRADLSNHLVHWVKGASDEDAFAVLSKIASEGRLLGSNGFIKGEFNCVCFTEAPQNTFHNVIGKYRPFGVQVSKRWLFSQGGRPVIYQPLADYDSLPESHNWRHVTYDLDHKPQPVDFSWEREWRIKTDELLLPPEARILVPHQAWAEALQEQHSESEEYRIQMEALAYGEEWLMQDPEPFHYAYSVINV
ncbi:MAG: hypothetical protein PHP86_17865 [Nevskiales bacterium]|nr:hypothetical protein [Nevskiales bacterium]